MREAQRVDGRGRNYDLPALAVNQDFHAAVHVLEQAVDRSHRGHTQRAGQNRGMAGLAPLLGHDRHQVTPVEVHRVGRQQLTGHQHRARRQIGRRGGRHVHQVAQHAAAHVAQVLLALAQVGAVGAHELIAQLGYFHFKSALGIDPFGLDPPLEAVRELRVFQDRKVGLEDARMGLPQLAVDAVADLVELVTRFQERAVQAAELLFELASRQRTTRGGRGGRVENRSQARRVPGRNRFSREQFHKARDVEGGKRPQMTLRCSLAAPRSVVGSRGAKTPDKPAATTEKLPSN